jgi:hypothetical protein
MNDQTRLERTSLVVPSERCELRLEDAGITITKQPAAQQEPIGVAFPVSQVRGATLERPSRGRPGWLHVSVIGGTPAPTADLAAALDPYTLPVTSRNVAVARRLVRLVTEHVRQRGLPPEPSPASPRRSTSVTVTSPPSPAADTAAATAAPAAPTGSAPAEPAPTEGAPAEPAPAEPAPAHPPAHPPAPAAETSPPPAGQGTGGDLVGTLRELADLHASGALSDDEFERAKAKVLGGDRPS